MTEPRILHIDIETSPNLGYFWKLFDENIGISQIKVPTEMLCFASKWHGKRPISFFSQFHDGREAMVEAAHELLDAADIVIHYNGKSFDTPHFNREFIRAGMTPPSPYKQIDLYHVVRRQFKFPSNKLAYVAEALGVGSKVKHQGFELWQRCMDGDPKAWEQMRRYNKQDVALLEKVYNLVLPWVPQHPNLNVITGTDGCPSCGSTDLERRGFARTAVSTFQQYRCRACGTWSRGKERQGETPANRGVAL